MNQTQKLLFSIILVLLITVVSFDISLYWAIDQTPNEVKVTYTTLQDKKIPESLNDVTIAYITDLQYGEFENDKRTKKVFDTLNELNPDILIFGGDLYDGSADVSKSTNQKMVKYFSSVDAPLGKFAVWGEKDWVDQQHKDAVKSIYHDAQVELLHNSNVRIVSDDTRGVRLIGLTSTNDAAQALDSVSGKTYNILVTHKPDNFLATELADHAISYGMAGHSHGTQLTFPIMGAYQTVSGAKKINLENMRELSFPYIVSPGLGCTNVNMRYGSTPEIHCFILKH